MYGYTIWYYNILGPNWLLITCFKTLPSSLEETKCEASGWYEDGDHRQLVVGLNMNIWFAINISDMGVLDSARFSTIITASLIFVGVLFLKQSSGNLLSLLDLTDIL